MSEAGKRIIEGAEEALRVAKGEQPAASIWHNGFEYVPRVQTRNDAPVTAATVDDIAQLIINYFADVAKGYADDLPTETEFQRGYKRGRIEAHGSIKAEIRDYEQKMPFWTHDLSRALKDRDG